MRGMKSKATKGSMMAGGGGGIGRLQKAAKARSGAGNSMGYMRGGMVKGKRKYCGGGKVKGKR